MAKGQTNWHHLFGLMMQDYFRGTPCEVELERDLSVKSQFLDVLLVHKTGAVIERVLPDGLEGHLVGYDLIANRRRGGPSSNCSATTTTCANRSERVSTTRCPKTDWAWRRSG